jgi:hypothetical protein
MSTQPPITAIQAPPWKDYIRELYKVLCVYRQNIRKIMEAYSNGIYKTTFAIEFNKLTQYYIPNDDALKYITDYIGAVICGNTYYIYGNF